jgi:hypothetical protein
VEFMDASVRAAGMRMSGGLAVSGCYPEAMSRPRSLTMMVMRARMLSR